MPESSQHEDYRRIYNLRLWSVAWSLGFLLLMPPGPALGQTDEETEQVFWQSVECQSARQVQAYLEVYPRGRYLAEAWACLEGQLGLDRAERRLVQQGLAALDYSPGPADGVFGGATRAAVRQWQRAKGEPVTGYLIRALADALIAQGREAVAEQRKQAEARRQVQAETTRKQPQPGETFQDCAVCPQLENIDMVIAGKRTPKELKEYRNTIAHWHTGRIDYSYLSDLQRTAMELLRRKYRPLKEGEAD